MNTKLNMYIGLEPISTFMPSSPNIGSMSNTGIIELISTMSASASALISLHTRASIIFAIGPASAILASSKSVTSTILCPNL